MFSFFLNKNHEELAQEAQKAFINLEYKKAINLYKKAITKVSNDNNAIADYYFYLAIINKELNNTKKALNNINKAIEIKDDNFNYYFERAEIQDLLKENSSEQDREKAYYLLKGYLSDEDYVEALKIIEFPLRERSQADKYSLLYLKINNSFKALAIINKFIMADKNDITLYDLKTDILNKMEKTQEAINTINRAIELAPKCGHYYMMRSILYKNINNYKNAKSDIEKALNSDLNEEDRANAESIKNGL